MSSTSAVKAVGLGYCYGEHLRGTRGMLKHRLVRVLSDKAIPSQDIIGLGPTLIIINEWAIEALEKRGSLDKILEAWRKSGYLPFKALSSRGQAALNRVLYKRVDSNILMRLLRKQAVKNLLTLGADPRVLSLDPNLGFARAVHHQDMKQCRRMLILGADPDAYYCGRQASGEERYLDVAVKRNQRGLVRMLIKYGADTNADYDEQASPLELAVVGNHGRLVDQLIVNGADMEEEISEDYILDEGTVLHLAAELGCLAALKVLIKRGANLEAGDYGGRTPWQLAVHHGQHQAAALLAEAGASTQPHVETPGCCALM